MNTDVKIQSISDLRFSERKQVKRMVKACQLDGAVIDMDKNGFFVHSFTMPAWLAALPTQAQKIEALRNAVPEIAATKEKKAPVRNIKNGACDQIRAWARANPTATKADGVAQFPNLNPSTIQIQMRKVRLGLV